MKKTTSVNVKLVALVAILMAIVFSVSALLLGRSTISASAAVSDNCGYNEDNVYVDYSGQGTVINGTLAYGNQAQVSGDYINVPIYKGSYSAAWYNGWGWHSWSSWSTENYYNTKINDYETYRGDTATEYDVRDRKEYQYRRNESRDVYSTKYYTTYQGAKWYNCWIFLFTSSWSGYGGEKSGYKIVNRYTKSEKSGTKQVTVYDNEWKASAPFNWAWENKWEAYNSRTTYSYRSREMKWDSKSNVGYEQAPLNYSLYNKNSTTPIDYGIKYTVKKDISQVDDRAWYQKLFMPFRMEDCYSVTQYYLNIESCERSLRSAITTAANSGDSIAEYIIGYSAKGIWSGIGAALKYFGKQAVFKSLGKYMIVAQVVLTGVDAFLSYFKKQTIAEFNAVLDSIDEGNKILLIQNTTYQNLNDMNGSFPIPYWDIRVIEEDIQYISMKYDYERANKYNLYNYSNQNYYGYVSYLKDINEVTDAISSYLNSFDIFKWASFIPA